MVHTFAPGGTHGQNAVSYACSVAMLQSSPDRCSVCSRLRSAPHEIFVLLLVWQSLGKLPQINKKVGMKVSLRAAGEGCVGSKPGHVGYRRGGDSLSQLGGSRRVSANKSKWRACALCCILAHSLFMCSSARPYFCTQRNACQNLVSLCKTRCDAGSVAMPPFMLNSDASVFQSCVLCSSAL